MTTQARSIKYAGSNISYTVTGAGTSVMLLHGFAEDSKIWDEQVIFLKNHYRLITPDIPGSGRSDMLTKPGAGLNDYAEVIKSIIVAERVKHFILIGHSMGGYIALAFAEKYPADLIALGLFHSSVYADDINKIQSRRRSIDFIGKNGTAAFLTTSVPALFYDTVTGSHRIQQLIQTGNIFKPETLIQYHEAMIARPNRSEVLEEAVFPVLLVIGEHDKAIAFKDSLRQAPLANCTYVQILRKSSHMGMLEETGTANRILAEFLHGSVGE